MLTFPNQSYVVIENYGVLSFLKMNNKTLFETYILFEVLSQAGAPHGVFSSACSSLTKHIKYAPIPSHRPCSP